MRRAGIGRALTLVAWHCLAVASALAQEPARAVAPPGKTSALAGTVRDTLGRPIRMVAVLVEGTELSAITDDSGRFHVRGIPAGPADFTVRKIGFSLVEFGTTLQPDSTLVLEIRMKSLTTLGAVNVTAPTSPRLHSTGFYERKATGLGSFLAPEKLDSLSNLFSASMMVQQSLARGARRVCPPRGNSCDLVFPRICRWLFVDGRQVEGSFDENVQPAEVYAIEIYDRIAIVPAEFQGRLPMSRQSRTLSPTAGCGAIAVWTRGRAAP